jgi:septal ring factor EnvC (AmiA/AmiB activator)
LTYELVSFSGLILQADLNWLPPVIISAVVTFVSIFMTRHQSQSDRGLETSTNVKQMKIDLEEVKKNVITLHDDVKELKGKEEKYDYIIKESKETHDHILTDISELQRKVRIRR